MVNEGLLTCRFGSSRAASKTRSEKRQQSEGKLVLGHVVSQVEMCLIRHGSYYELLVNHLCRYDSS